MDFGERGWYIRKVEVVSCECAFVVILFLFLFLLCVVYSGWPEALL